MGLNTTPRTWVTGELVTAAEMNTEIRDPLTALQSAWVNYTPVLASTGTQPVLGTGSAVSGRYLQIGKTINVYGRVQFGTSGYSFGTGAYTITLPVTANAAHLGPYGQVVLYPGGSYWVPGWAAPSGGNAFSIYASGSSTNSPTGQVTGTSTPGGVAWGPTADMRFNFTYEAA